MQADYGLYCLDRTRISGPLGELTPNIVIVEIAQAHGIVAELLYMTNPEYRADVLKMIALTNKIMVKPDDRSCFGAIARFINPSKTIAWDSKSLSEAFTFFTSFSSEHMNLHTAKFGLQTPEETRNINSTLMYKICLERSIPHNQDTTFDEMTKMIRFSMYKPEYLHTFLFNLISTMTQQQLIVALVRLGVIPPSIETREYKKPTKEQLISASRAANGAYVPTSHEEAIVHAAKKFDIDLINTDNPLAELHALERGNFPIREKTKEMLQKDPDCLSLKRYFNPLLPKVAYRMEILRDLATREGFSAEEIDSGDPYEMISRDIETFYPSGPGRPETEDLVYWGTRFKITNQFQITKLLLHFASSKDFLNPHSGVRFDTRSIRKLKRLIQRRQGDWTIIDTVNIRLKIGDRLNSFNKLRRDQNLRKEVFKFFENIMNAAMITRGWDQLGPYPLTDISSEETLVGHEMLAKIVNEVPDNLKSLLELPSIDYKDGYLLDQSLRKVEDLLKESRQPYSIIKLIYSAYLYLSILGTNLSFKVWEIK